MNIAIFSDTFLPSKNGVATSIAQLKNHLTQKGHTVYIYTVSMPGVNSLEEENVIRSTSINAHLGISEGRIPFANIPRISHRIKKDQIDIIHTHSEFAMGLIGRYISRHLNIPHIHTQHTMWENYSHYFFKGLIMHQRQINTLFRGFVSRCTAVIAPSAKALAYLDSINVQGYIINNGVDERLFTRETTQEETRSLRDSLGFTNDDVVCLFVGRMAQEKRVLELYDVLKRTMQHNSRIKALFIGEGTDLEKLKEKALEDKLEKAFVFTGFLPYEKISPYYASCNIYCTISTSEVQPMTVIEALISGLPVVCSNDLAYTGLAVPGKNGYMAPSDDDAVEALLNLASNDELRQQYSQSSKKIAHHFSAARQADEMERLYLQAIEVGRPKKRHTYPIHQ